MAKTRRRHSTTPARRRRQKPQPPRISSPPTMPEVTGLLVATEAADTVTAAAPPPTMDQLISHREAIAHLIKCRNPLLSDAAVERIMERRDSEVELASAELIGLVRDGVRFAEVVTSGVRPVARWVPREHLEIGSTPFAGRGMFVKAGFYTPRYLRYYSRADFFERLAAKIQPAAAPPCDHASPRNTVGGVTPDPTSPSNNAVGGARPDATAGGTDDPGPEPDLSDSPMMALAVKHLRAMYRDGFKPEGRQTMAKELNERAEQEIKPTTRQRAVRHVKKWP